MTTKVKAKLDAIAQLAATGMKGSQIREQLGIPLGTYKRIIALQEYREREQELLAERSEQLKTNCALGVEALQARVSNELSATLNRLLSLRGSKNERVALEACKDLLDRDPSRALVKVSRTALARSSGPSLDDLTPAQWKMLEKDSNAVVAEMRAARANQKLQ